MSYQLLYAPTFLDWWTALSEEDRPLVAGSLQGLAIIGPELRQPFVFPVKNSFFSTLMEMHIPCGKRTVRVFFGYDVRKRAMLLLDGADLSSTDYFDEKTAYVDSVYSCYFGGYPNRDGVPHGL